MEKVKKLKKEKYIRIKPDVFKGWISEIMKEERFRYASARVVAEEIQRRYGGLVSSHMGRIRAMRLNMQDFLPGKDEHKFDATFCCEPDRKR